MKKNWRYQSTYYLTVKIHTQSHTNDSEYDFFSSNCYSIVLLGFIAVLKCEISFDYS